MNDGSFKSLTTGVAVDFLQHVFTVAYDGIPVGPDGGTWRFSIDGVIVASIPGDSGGGFQSTVGFSANSVDAPVVDIKPDFFAYNYEAPR